ncbi:putative epoxide hydrolase [Frankia canadensis]|uniref:Putative epoxide hydrolase n=1 Tax=Frankia canadensis TaxID=1836972 RepID=A0A2I2KS08_9ACTN|nr:epoxide hydrolase family protein [Frankia canadensis]SNQ48458.1 putative epoxide hydrolase [Frankia canadensis]SOU55748.1 putative epoxide hydrolase [Frankia canadensis]
MSIEPFRIAVPQADLDDLHARLDRTRWPDELPGVGDEFGVPLARVRDLADHWRHRYDWRAAEAELNTHPQYVTEIDGQRIHFLHIRSPRPDALPLVLTHGWPGSIIEFLDVIEPLSVDFHLVIPSIPGWGFSGPTRERGWDVDRVARAWAELMRRLGYRHYGAHGGDWGMAISRALSQHDAEHVVAIHLTYLPTPQAPGDPDRADLSAEDQQRLAQIEAYQRDQPAVRTLNGTRPQTPAYALTDSPVGLLAWLLDPMTMWAARDFPISAERVLTNVTLFWLTGTGGTAPRLHRETGGRPPQWRTVQPVGILVLPEDITRPVRPYAERRLPILRWTEADRGGHFPGLEVPALLAADIRHFFLTVGITE